MLDIDIVKECLAKANYVMSQKDEEKIRSMINNINNSPTHNFFTNDTLAKLIIQVTKGDE